MHNRLEHPARGCRLSASGMKDRIRGEDALKHLHECEYQGLPATLESVAGALGRPRGAVADVLAELQGNGWVRVEGLRFFLTDSGRAYARRLVRAHRLYETYLARHDGAGELTWHPRAETREHELSTDQLAEMARELGHPRFDPHGDPIPTARGELAPLQGVSLLEWPTGCGAIVLHVEDEPRPVYEELVRRGVAAGMRLEILGRAADSLRCRVEGALIDLTLPMAANLRVRARTPAEEAPPETCRLSTLRPGERATILGLTSACRGPERSRLLDLGVVPGSEVTLDLPGPFGSPNGYRLRDALVALRREQAEQILVVKG